VKLLMKNVLIVALRQEGCSIRAIAEKTGVTHPTVLYTLRRKTETGSNSSRSRLGRPRVTTKHEDKFICVSSKRERTRTAPDLRAELNGMRDTPVSTSTVQRRLREYGLMGRIAVKKPFLRKQNKIKRLGWARKYSKWTVKQWSKVLFTDESKFEIFGGKRRVYVRRMRGERCINQYITPTVKHGGGSVMVGGCFGNDKVGDLIHIKDTLTKERYHRILQYHALPSGMKLIGRGFILQQDNDPKHTSTLCKRYVESKEKQGELVNMAWPAQSLDLNPIELLWDELDRKVRAMRPTNLNQLWECLQTCRNEFATTTLNKLIARMPKVCEAVRKAKGGYFNESKI